VEETDVDVEEDGDALDEDDNGDEDELTHT